MSRRPARRAPLRFRLAAALAVLLVVGLFAEGGARMVAPQVPSWRGQDTGTVIMVGHPTRLWGMGPGVRQNAGVPATITELGLRAPLPDGPRPPGRERVLILGDSTYFGHGVVDDETLGAQLQARLRADGVDVEVMNGGIPGYSSEQTRLLLDEVGWGLEPTLLVLGNLWSDNNFDHFRDQDLLRTHAAFAGNPLAKSSFFQILAGAMDRLRGGEGARIVTWTRDSAWPTEGVRRVPLRRYAENLDHMVREAAARGVGAVFFAPANAGMSDGTIPYDTAWKPYFEAQAAVAAHHGLPIVQALPPLAAASAARGGAADLFVDEMHPSAVGFGILAGAVADTLRDAGWPQKRLHGRVEGLDLATIPVEGRDARTTPTNPLSPQVNLFVDASPSGGGGGGGVGVQPTDGAWFVEGTVAAQAFPVRVEVRRTSGEPLSVAVLGAAGPFRVKVRKDQERVLVVATDAEGREARAEAERDGEKLTLSVR